LRPGDIVIHYRTRRAPVFRKMFVGFSKVKSLADVVSREELRKKLEELNIWDKEYEDFSERWLGKYDRFYLVDLEEFQGFMVSLKEASEKTGVRIQQAYIFQLEQDKAESLIEIGFKRESTVSRMVEWFVGRLAEAAQQHKLIIAEDVLKQVIAALSSGKHVILVGPPGTGKTSLARLVARSHGLEEVVVTATSEWSRLDVIGGPVFMGGEVRWRTGCLLEAVARWFLRGGRGVLLVIDEINRANMDRAFGEFFTIFSSSEPDQWEVPASILEEISEYGNRCDKWGRILLKAWKDKSNKGESGGLKIPKGFRIIATMNTFDRRYLFTLGYALLRRFAVVEIDNPPDHRLETLLSRYTAKKNIVDDILGLYRGTREKTGVEVGVALLIDVVKYADRLVEEGMDIRNAVSRAFASVVLFQFEGLSLDRLKSLRRFFDETGRRELVETFDRLFPEAGE